MTDWTHLLKHASPDVQELNADVLDGKRKPQAVTEKPRPASKLIIDGIQFDSRDEAQRYVTLRAMERSGLISCLKCHPTYTLVDGFTDNRGVEYGPITYSADFVYHEDRMVVIEDVKGTKWNKRKTRKLFLIERDAKLRMKMFAHKYCRDVFWEFRVVDKHGEQHQLKWK